MYSLSLWLVVVLALNACGSQTRIRVTIEGETATLDLFQLKVEGRVAVADPLQTLDLLVTDAMAGNDAKVELWGLHGGEQVAYGTAIVRPALHDTVEVRITLVAISCGAWCNPGSTTCANNGTGDGTRACVQRADGCTEWGATTTCPTATPFCSNGSCAETCSDECAVGETECDGAVATHSCGQHDADECLDWSPTNACGVGQSCSNNMCSTSQTCATGDGCDDGNGCTDNDACTGGGVCEGDPRVCGDLPPVCTNASTMRLWGPGATCSTSTGECSSTYNDATCGRGCTAGACREQVSAGGGGTCVIKTDGTLQSWGVIPSTQLPPGTFSAISVKRMHGCGTTTSGATMCWTRQAFDNFYGEATVPSGTFGSVSAGDGFTCAVRTTGALACWGNPSDMSVRIDPPTGSFKAVSCGVAHSCALRTDGTAACWGLSATGETTALGGTFTRIAAGYQFSCGIRPSRAIECWGTIPTPPPGSYIALSAGFDHACAVRSDGVAKCWGPNTSGKATPISGVYSSVTAGEQHACGMKTNGKIACWGSNAEGATSVPSGL